jgi:perosamine synthetase
MLELADWLSQYYAPSEVHLLNYGHHAIEASLHMFKKRRPDRFEVIVPAYICPSVIRSIVVSGLVARCIDVREDLNLGPSDVQTAITQNTLAVIAPHMYGCPARIDEIESLCDSAGVYLVDDAAQVVGIRLGSRLLGSFGDTGVISFAQSKTVVTGIRGSGGVLLVNRDQWQSAAGLACERLAPATDRLSALGDFLWNYVGHRYTGHTGYYFDRIFSRFREKHRQVGGAQQISNLDASLALVQLDRLELIIEEKIRISNDCHEALKLHPRLSFPQYMPGRFLTRVMLMLPNGTSISQVRNAARARGVETRVGYSAQRCPDFKTPRADALTHRLIGVPCRAGMRFSEIVNICQVLEASIGGSV